MSRAYCILSVLVVLALLLSACQPVMPQAPAEPQGLRPDAPPYAVHGPYAVGVRDFVIEGTEEYTRPLTMSVWYPALNPNGAPEEIAYKMDITPGGEFGAVPVYGHALQDAEPATDGAPYPLVLYSHGAWSFRQSAAYLVEHLASHGFTVIAPDHVDNWGTLFQPVHMAEISRPIELRRTLDYGEELTAAGGALEGLIDMERVAAAGWSFGGEEALILAGARLNLDEFFAFCEAEDNPIGDCEYTQVVDEMAQAAGLDAPPEGLWPDWSDPRIDALVALAPGAHLFGETGTQAVHAPALFVEGSLDESVGLGLDHFRSYDHLPSTRKTRATFEGAGHLIHFNGCAANPGIVDQGLFWVCSDPVWDMDRAHDLINHFVTAFLLAELKGDADAAAALAPENVSFPGIQYETTAYGVAAAEPSVPAGLEAATVAEIEALVAETMAGGKVPGAAVGVVKDGALVYAKGFGVTELDGDTPITPESVFSMASVSKSIVAMAIMQLVEEGKIDLDAPVTTYLPYFAMADPAAQEITIRQLLSHTSGLPDVYDWTAAVRTDAGALEDYVRSLNGESLLFLPGTDWAYSDTDFNVLGDVIAKVSGTSFEEYVQAHILAPLGMESSSFLLSEVDPALLVSPHVIGENGNVAINDFVPYNRLYAPAGNLFSSVPDMARFVIANMNHGELDGVRVLPDSAYTEMWAPQAASPWVEWFGSALSHYGLGWWVGDLGGHPDIGNYGAIPGYQSHLAIFPEDGIAVVAIVNLYDEETGAFHAFEIGNGISELLLGLEPAAQ